MTTLILIYSLKSIYNHNLDSIVVPNLNIKSCTILGNKITEDLKNINPHIEINFYCE